MSDVWEQGGRCGWCGEDPDYIRYHDAEWGVPLTDSQRLFELLILEGAQAGLSWITILRKREGYRLVFEDFRVERLAAWPDARLNRALQSPSIVRNRLKVNAVRQNAKAVMALEDSGISLSQYLWAFVNDRPIVNAWTQPRDVPAKTDLSIQISRDMKQRGFSFVGPTIIYAFLQAAGMVNDHLVTCFRHQDCINMVA